MKIKLSILFLTTIIFISGQNAYANSPPMPDPLELNDTFQAGLKYEKEGKINEAIQKYRQVVATQWKDSDADNSIKNYEAYLNSNEAFTEWMAGILEGIDKRGFDYSKLTAFSNEALKKKREIYQKSQYGDGALYFPIELTYEESVAFFNHLLQFSHQKSRLKNLSAITVNTPPKQRNKAFNALLSDLLDYDYKQVTKPKIGSSNFDYTILKAGSKQYGYGHSGSPIESPGFIMGNYLHQIDQHSVITEASKNLIKLLDPKKNAAEIEDLKNKIKQLKKLDDHSME